MKSTQDLRRNHPEMRFPMFCENGCGAIIEMIDGFISYEKA